MEKTFKISYVDIDEREGQVYDSYYAGETAKEAIDALTEDCSGAGYDIEVIAVNELQD
jgi:hypothetical protein